MINTMNQSKRSAPFSSGEGGERLSLLELNALVRRSLEQCLPDEYWIQAELSDVRSNTTGHCYLEFVQKDPRSNSLIAKARGMIWNTIYRLLKPYFEETTGQPFTSGIKVLVKVTVQFHELYGYSLTVLDIDPAYTLGDMARRRREILLQLEEEGVLTLNKELEMPQLPQRIAVVPSATAAGYGDFCHQLQHNPGGFFFYTELFPALMQGNQVEESRIFTHILEVSSVKRCPCDIYSRSKLNVFLPIVRLFTESLTVLRRKFHIPAGCKNRKSRKCRTGIIGSFRFCPTVVKDFASYTERSVIHPQLRNAESLHSGRTEFGLSMT